MNHCFTWKQISLNMKNLIGIIPIFSENVASNKIWGHSQNLHRFGPFYHWQHPKLILEAATDWLEIQLGTNSHQHWISSLSITASKIQSAQKKSLILLYLTQFDTVIQNPFWRLSMIKMIQTRANSENGLRLRLRPHMFNLKEFFRKCG